MADETSWVPQKPRAQAPTNYHTRSSSIGWRNNLPFSRKRADSTTVVDDDEKKTEMAGSSIVQGLRKRGTRAFKRSNTANDISVAAAAARDKTAEKEIPTKAVTAVQAPAIIEPNAADSKLTIPEELTRELNKLAVARRSKSFDDLNGQKNIPTSFAKGPTDGFWENPREVPGASRRLSRSPGVSPAPVGRRTYQRTASLSPHPPFTSPRPQSAWQPSTSPRPASAMSPRPRSASPQPPAVQGLPTSPRPPQAFARSRSVSPRPPSRGGLPASPRPPSASPRPSGPNNSWQQEAAAAEKSEKDENVLKIITEFSPPTPPESTRSVTPAVEETNDDSPSGKTVDGIEFEMLPTPKRFSLHSSRLFLDDEAPMPELPHFLSLPTPGLPKEVSIPPPVLTLSPETVQISSFPPPPPIPDMHLTAKQRRWTTASNARASSILLPDAFEQPETPKRKAHKRASSENDADTMEVEYKDGVIVVPTRPPTPPPKPAGLPVTPGQFASRKSSLSYSKSARAAKSFTERQPARSDERSASVPAVPTLPALLPTPPSCARGTLPTPRSKYNPQFTAQSKSPEAAAAPPMPTSAGARIAAAAAKATSLAQISRSMSLKIKPPGRSPPPVPSLPNGGKSKTSPPSRQSSNSRALKRRSSGSDKDGKQITDRVKKSATGTVSRTKSQVRRELVKRMALDNIGAVKVREARDAPKSPVRTRSPPRPTTSGRNASPPRPVTPPRPQTAGPAMSRRPSNALSRKPSAMRLEMTLDTRPEPAQPAKVDELKKPNESSGKLLPLPESSQEMRNSLIKIQTAELAKITSLAAELKQLEEQCEKARQHQKALNDARQRLQDIPDSPTDSATSESSEASTQSSGSSSARSQVLAQLDNKIEKWRKEVQQAEHKRNRIQKKLAWHSADRLKLIPPPSSNAVKPAGTQKQEQPAQAQVQSQTQAKAHARSNSLAQTPARTPAPTRPLPHRPVSMFSPTSVYSGYSEDGGVVLPPLPSHDALVKLNSASAAPNALHGSHSRNTSVSSRRTQHSRNASTVSKLSTHSRNTSISSQRSNHSRNVSVTSTNAYTPRHRNHSAAPSLDASIGARPSVDEGVMDYQPPTPKEDSPPLTSANKPWMGLENPFLTAPSLPGRSPGFENAIKSPVSVIGVGAGPDRQTIQLFASEDVMEVIRSAGSSQNSQDQFALTSPVPRLDRHVTIQVFADAGITDLVSALQQEIENMGRDRWD